MAKELLTWARLLEWAAAWAQQWGSGFEHCLVPEMVALLGLASVPVLSAPQTAHVSVLVLGPASAQQMVHASAFGSVPALVET